MKSSLLVLLSFFLTAGANAQPDDVLISIRCQFIASVTTPGTFWDGGTDEDAPTRAGNKLMDELDYGNTELFREISLTERDIVGQKAKTISVRADEIELIRTKDRLAGRFDNVTTLSDHVDADSIDFDVMLTPELKFAFFARVMKDGEDTFSTDSISEKINMNFSVKSKLKSKSGKSLFFQYSVGCVSKDHF